MTDSADKRIESYLLAGKEPEDAADAAFSDCRKAELRHYVMPLFRSRARELARRMARKVEDLVMNMNPPEEKHEHRVAAVQKIAETSFSLPDGRRVLWPDATVEDHVERAGWIQKEAYSALETARRHRVAADLLRKRRKKRLGDIADWQEVLAAAVSEVEEAA